MSEYISREAVKQLLRMEMKFSIEAMVADPEVIPSADVRPNIHGHWEYGFTFPDGNYCRCSACQEIIKCIYPMRYCPACGADMREPKGEKGTE